MIEETILTNLIENKEYARKVLPFLRVSYFQTRAEKIIFESYVLYYERYKKPPQHKELAIEITERENLSETEYEEAVQLLESLSQDEPPNLQWLVDKTEEWCKERAIYNAIMDSINIIDGEDTKRTTHAIPELLKEALAVSFDTNIGHDYFDDAEKRFEFYNEEHERIPFDIKLLNKITNGGVPNKTLNVILGGTNIGKTMAMVHLAAHYMSIGKNVLYITLEMSEEMISNRIDANLMDLTVNEVERLPESKFFKYINSIRKKTNGKLIVKEYPTATAHVGHFRVLLQELELKKNFKPDVIFIDYIGIAASSRIRLGATGSYGYIKAIAEEFRGLAVENDVPLWTAVQSNRSGFASSDVDITDTAESFGLPATADFMFALIRTDELDELGQLMVKQLKNRYSNKSHFERFVIGVDPDRMKLFDVDFSAQKNVGVTHQPVNDAEVDKKAKVKGLIV